ncbi:hypothetical protein JOM56_001902, partial [Amanita muscaria]
MLIEIVYDWLFRAKSLPCSLALKFKADDRTLGVLESERWYKNIHAMVDQSLQFLQLPAEKLSCVEDLHICMINPPSLSNFGVLPSQAPLDSFKKLTKLTSLRLDQSLRGAFRDVVYLQDSVFVHVVPWHQIRHIHLSIPTSVFFCFTILQKSSMVLETCSFVVIGHYNPWAEIQTLYAEPLYCLQLRTLELDARLLPGQLFSAMILDPILLWIRMPNLKALTVGSSDWTSQELVSFSSLVGMQDVSNMQLKELTLYNHRSAMDVADLLRTFPSLKRIDLSGHTFLDDDTINQLGSGLVAPCLEELIIH